jgi:translation elongation factor EF-4
MGPHSNKMVVEFFPKIKSYSDEFKSSNYKIIEIESY